MKIKIVFLLAFIFSFSPYVIAQIQESLWRYFRVPTTANVDETKTKAVIEKDLLVVYNIGSTTRYFQADFVKKMWDSYPPIPDSMLMTFKLSESSDISKIKEFYIALPYQDSTSFSFSQDTRIGIRKDWQDLKIPCDITLKNVVKIYLRFVMILIDDSTLKPVDVIVEIKKIVGIYKDGRKYFFHGSEATIVSQELLIPDKFALYQNYPNPFNPSTSIKYSIPKNEFVSLKVYDVLGTEVATLVDEEKFAGNYNVQFNSSSLASGVCLYRLQAGSFVQTKKLMLMK